MTILMTAVILNGVSILMLWFSIFMLQRRALELEHAVDLLNSRTFSWYT